MNASPTCGRRTLVVALCMAAALSLRSFPGAAESSRVYVEFDPGLQAAAERTVAFFPQAERRLERLLGWKLGYFPRILVLGGRKRFVQVTGRPLAVAVAVPAQRLVIVDYDTASRRPFGLEKILTHELCHLILHEHIPPPSLPRWLDEGICQWVSDGVSDILGSQMRLALPRLAWKGRQHLLQTLRDRFPEDPDGQRLAYEASRSFVDHLVRHFGAERVPAFLHLLQEGHGLEPAARRAFSASLGSLQEQWYRNLRDPVALLQILGYPLYGFVFGILALLAFAGFIRLWRKKRAYLRE